MLEQRDTAEHAAASHSNCYTQDKQSPLPHFLRDNVPFLDFDATVECALGAVKVDLAAEQFIDAVGKPAKVLIDARDASPVAFEQLMAAYLSDRQKHPGKDAVIITGNALTSQHRTMQTFQHTYTVGLRSKRCKSWHDPACVLRSEQQLSSILKASIVGANARMLDSGAAADCISLKFCELMKLKIQPIAGADISTVSGQSEQVAGTAPVTISIHSYKSKRRMLVIPMTLDCDAILGEPWHAST